MPAVFEHGIELRGGVVDGPMPSVFGRLFVYYDPNLKNLLPQYTNFNGTSSEKIIAAFLAQYDHVVLDKDIIINGTRPVAWGGSGVVVSSNTTNGNFAKNVVTELLVIKPDIKIYGYVPLGQGPGTNDPIFALNQTEINLWIDEWNVVGVNGVFFDQVGYDFQVPRTTANSSVTHARTHSMVVCVNSWQPEDALDDAVDVTYNPAGTASVLGAGDSFLMESFAANVSTATQSFTYGQHFQNFRATTAGNGVQGFKERLEAALAGRDGLGVSLFGLAIIPRDNRFRFHYDFVEALAVLANVDALGFSATDGFADDDPIVWTPKDWPMILGPRSLYDPGQEKSSIQTITNVFGTPTGLLRRFSRTTLFVHYDSTTGNYAWRAGDRGGDYSEVSAEPGDSPWKAPVRVAVTSNVDLTVNSPVGLFDALGKVAQSQDGVTLNVMDGVLLVGQTSAAENGLYYVVQKEGGFVLLRRRGDMKLGSENHSGAVVPVLEGTAAGQMYKLTTANPLMVGTTALVFVRQSWATVMAAIVTGLSSVNGAAYMRAGGATIDWDSLPDAPGQFTVRWNQVAVSAGNGKARLRDVTNGVDLAEITGISGTGLQSVVLTSLPVGIAQIEFQHAEDAAAGGTNDVEDVTLIVAGA